jgi:putative flippase GtrA
LSSSKSPLFRFLIAGSATVGVDAVVYAALLGAGMPVDPAKTLGLVAATVFAYLVNRNWTFGAGHGGLGRFLGFLALYVLAIALNVGVNRIVLELVGTGPHHVTLAWFFATAASSTWNYIGMRWVVFRPLPASLTDVSRSATKFARDRMS